MAETHKEEEIEKRNLFDKMIERRWGTLINPPKEYIVKTPDNEEVWENYQDNDEIPRIMPSQEEIVDHKNNTLCQQPAYDKMINAEVTLQCGETIEEAKFIRRSMGPDGKTTGEYDGNPRLNLVILMARSKSIVLI